MTTEKARIWFLKGNVWVDMSKEQIYTHVQVKTKYIIVLGGLVEAEQLKGHSHLELNRTERDHIEACVGLRERHVQLDVDQHALLDALFEVMHADVDPHLVVAQEQAPAVDEQGVEV